jgi:16S rRNA C967 or C1407 C5-methylase (RsmB/RsmF family)
MGRGNRKRKNKSTKNNDTKSENNDNTDTANSSDKPKSNGNQRELDKANYSLLSHASNPKMEAYYAFQGLHSHRRKLSSSITTTTDENNTTTKMTSEFEPCVTLEEMEHERQLWKNALTTVLPASFRIGNNIEQDLKEKIKQEIDDFVGKEIEILICEDGRNLNRSKKDDSVDNSDIGNKESCNALEETIASNGHSSSNPDVDNDEKSDSNNENDNSLDLKTTTKIIAPAKKIPFIPNAYQLSVDRRTLRRNPTLENFHSWLKLQVDAGFVTRQETVSMIPPVVLNAEPHHAVLDMCAAPGSKTSQLLEIVGTISDGNPEPGGFIVANDSDARRAYMLVHQLRRLNSPAALVTSVDAQFWPMLNRGLNTSDEERAQEGIFDRVLCDVPCSGDGTARKNLGIWKHWTALGAFGLHPLQISIALNGARLTKVGGYMCYSTCSMNPIENEAVVAELLRLTDGSLELVDKRSDMSGFVARPGWNTWKVLSEKKRRRDIVNKQKKNNQKMQERRKAWEEKNAQAQDDNTENATSKSEEVYIETETSLDDKSGMNSNDGDDDEVKFNKDEWVYSPPSWDENALLERALSTGLVYHKTFDDVPEESQKRIRASCFPPSSEEVERFNLQKCMRCLPQDLDTGGFFVALFRKISPLSDRAKRKANDLAENSRPDVNPDDMVDDLPSVKKGKMDDGEPSSGIDVVMEDKSDVDVVSTEDVEDNNNQKLVKGKPLLRGRGKSRGDMGNDDFKLVQEDVISPILADYGLPIDFAKDQFMTRSKGQAKMITFITSEIKKILIDRGVQDRVTIINAGLRAFERGTGGGGAEAETLFRPCQESIHFLAPYMTKRKLIANIDDFSNCLTSGIQKCSTERFSEDFAKELSLLSTGSFVICLKGYEENVAKKMFAVMWKCRGNNMNCLVTKAEIDGMHSKLNAIRLES